MFVKLVIFFAIFLSSEMVLADTHAVQYTNVTFPIEMAKKDHFVMFYTTWCGHSLRLMPTWEELARSLNGIEGGEVRIAMVDCEESREVCSQNNVFGYPTAKFFRAGNSTGIKYTGTRSLESLTSFLNQKMRSSFPSSTPPTTTEGSN